MAFNEVKDLSPMVACDSLEVLDLEGNQVPFVPSPASERRGNTLKRLKDVYLKGTAIIWPWLSCMCQMRSAIGGAFRGAVPSLRLNRL